MGNHVTNEGHELPGPPPSFSPLLKWPGGKRGLLKFLLPLIPTQYRDYYEPFVGGGALFFALRPNRAYLADRNADLISTYRQVRDSPEVVIKSLQRLRNTEEDYYLVRASRPRTDAGQAARLLYLSRLSFNGIHRVNLQGQFNVPYGFKTYLEPCEAAKIRHASRILANIEITCEDFEFAVAKAGKGDLVYLDPPYTTAHHNNGFVKYNAKIFTWDDQRRLASVARDLVRRGCSVIVSNADHPTITRLYGDFDVVRLARYSVIAASRLFRRPITECIFYQVRK